MELICLVDYSLSVYLSLLLPVVGVIDLKLAHMTRYVYVIADSL